MLTGFCSSLCSKLERSRVLCIAFARHAHRLIVLLTLILLEIAVNVMIITFGERCTAKTRCCADFGREQVQKKLEKTEAETQAFLKETDELRSKK